MITALKNARLVLPDGIVYPGALLWEDGRILACGREEELDLSRAERVIDAKGLLAGPGFVDIHCHAGGEFWAYENPVAVARHHLAGGTTSMLLTMYHQQTPEEILRAAGWIREAMESRTPGNIAGIHMEGPYLSPKYGAHVSSARKPDPAEYEEYLRVFGDLVGQWTYSPEVEGTEAFAKRLKEEGITMAIGHSEANYEQVTRAVENGATICTHITDATGNSGKPFSDGTKAVSFDMACLGTPGMYLEMINDCLGAHVLPEMSRIIVRLAGVDRIIGITDACTGTAEPGTDINIVNGELYGSLLTMIDSARNFANNTKLSAEEVFRVCATNPARAIGLTDVGTLEPGKRANLVLVDEAAGWTLEGVFLDGEKVC